MKACGTAIECHKGSFSLSFRDSLISHSKRFGISITREIITIDADSPKTDVNQQKYDGLEDVAG